MMLTRDAILGAQDLKTVDVPVPEWGGDVRLRMLTGAERNALHAAAAAGGKFDATLFASLLVAKTIVGDDGGRLFGDDDAPALAAKSASAFNRVFEAAAKLNGLGGNAVDEAEGNSSAAQSGASS
jgi:hypothetical protein